MHLSSTPMEEIVMPLPMPEATPPVTMTYFMSRRTRDGDRDPAAPRPGEDMDGTRSRDGEGAEEDEADEADEDDELALILLECVRG